MESSQKTIAETQPERPTKVAAAVRCCRVQGTHVNFYLRLRPVHITLETNIMTALEKGGGDRLYGQDTRSSLERKTIDLLHKLGVQIDKPFGS